MTAESALYVYSVVVTGLAGLLVGSFLNVVVWRLPRGESIVIPPSACPACGARIRARDNIPVASWLLLRGRCRACTAPISARYPLVELATGLAFAGVAAWALVRPAGFALLAAYLVFAAVSIVLALIDLDVHRLPNAIVLPAGIVGTVLLTIASAVSGDWGAMLTALLGAAALFALYLVLALAVPRGMGFGDVKLAAVVGLHVGYFGWGALLVGAFAAFLLGGLYAIGLLLARRASRKSGIPFGPWMLAGAWGGIAAGEQLSGAYLALVGIE